MPHNTPPPDLMREFLHLWLGRRLYEQGHTRADLARHLGVPDSTVMRMLDGTSRYGKRDHVAPACEFLGVAPVDAYAAALRMWRRDPEGHALTRLREIPTRPGAQP